MRLHQKLARPAGILLAALVLILTVAVVGQALQTLKVANATLISFNLAPGAISAPITVPVADQSVLVMGATTTGNFRGVGHVSLLRASADPAQLSWVGVGPSTAIAMGYGADEGRFIVFLDFANQTRLEVQSATQFRVRNAATTARTGNVKIIW